MASPRELVECVSDVLKVPVATVTVHDRNLAVAGLRTVSGRGRAVAAVTADDAANLLIAVMASEQVRDSAASVHCYGSLISRGSKMFSGISDRLEKRHTLKEGLAGLIELLANEKLSGGGVLAVAVKFVLPQPSARIDFDNDLGNPILDYASLGVVKNFSENGDLIITKTITQVTLFTLAELLVTKGKSNAGGSFR